ncbi:MAG: tRNA-dihydrouridine synthase [Promethearchaeota archaeon]
MSQPINLRNPAILAAMAGITDGAFAQREAQTGAGGVTIGGFNIDKKSWLAAQEIVKTGRKEFIVHPTKIKENIQSQINCIDVTCPIFINIRFTELEALQKLSEILSYRKQLRSLVLEINAHCRQSALVRVGAGEGLFNNLDLLEKAILIPQEYNIPVSVKLRACSTDLSSIIDQFHDWGTTVLHIDSYVPGHAGLDFKTLKKVVSTSQLPIIANNSVWDIQTARNVLNIGCYAFSIARPVKNDPGLVGRLGSYFVSETEVK